MEKGRDEWEMRRERERKKEESELGASRLEHGEFWRRYVGADGVGWPVRKIYLFAEAPSFGFASSSVQECFFSIRENTLTLRGFRFRKIAKH